MANEIIEETEIRPDGSKKIVKRSVEKGISFGAALAMVISFATWKSVFCFFNNFICHKCLLIFFYNPISL